MRFVRGLFDDRRGRAFGNGYRGGVRESRAMPLRLVKSVARGGGPRNGAGRAVGRERGGERERASDLFTFGAINHSALGRGRTWRQTEGRGGRRRPAGGRGCTAREEEDAGKEALRHPQRVWSGAPTIIAFTNM